jgi:chemotaxis protein MotB
MADKKHKKCPECICKTESGSGRWMLTYLDMITLLFGVMIIMYAMSSANKAKAEQVAESLRMGFQGGWTIFQGNKSGGSTLIENLNPEGTRKKQLFNKFVSVLKEEVKNKSVNIKEEEGGIIISLAGDLYFATASAELNTDAERVLDKISSVLKDIEFFIRVEGHTDEMAVDQNTYLDNWQLAALRAANVVRFLEFIGIEPKKMSAISYGQYRPFFDKAQATPEARSIERRVDIVIPTDKKYIYTNNNDNIIQ